MTSFVFGTPQVGHDGLATNPFCIDPFSVDEVRVTLAELRSSAVAFRYGGPWGDAMRRSSHEARDRRLQLLEELAIALSFLAEMTMDCWPE